MKNIKTFPLKNVIFTAMKNHSILHICVLSKCIADTGKAVWAYRGLCGKWKECSILFFKANLCCIKFNLFALILLHVSKCLIL